MPKIHSKGNGNEQKTIANYLGKFGQTGLGFSELLALDDRKLDEIVGLAKTQAEETDPRKLHFNSLIGLHTITCTLKRVYSVVPIS